MDKDIAQLLSWYVNGTLTGPERDRVEVALRDDPRARALLEWEKSLRDSVQNDPQFDIAPDRGLSQVMQRIKADAKAAASSGARKTRAAAGGSGGGFSGRLREWFNWSPALALALGIVAVQFGVIVHMSTTRGEESEYAGVRSIKGRHQDAFVRVTFKAESTENDIRTLLRGIDAEIVAGPSQLGDYYVIVPASSVHSALTSLLSSAAVDSAEIVRALPARPS